MVREGRRAVETIKAPILSRGEPSGAVSKLTSAEVSAGLRRVSRNCRRG